ncbi:hypothetical protein [Gottfriedia solisilvae]|uniref:Uncharacterized protein n=1 Tax=Gottfriedia solisilvae TaxID=1516104 RepID=A0A8J3AQ90_9BACI|nr:hypothetical protein [Gottfriedia solisilvae]GGI17965.1 hypothetical protein GCM10007380_40570 [Gottfriedia solisilvae]
MKKISIYFSDDSELAEYESVSKEYRNDIFVDVSGEVFNIRAYTILRLQQDFETEIEDEGYFSVEPNLVLVSDTSRQSICQIIRKLYEQKYFNELKPIIINTSNLVQVMSFEI